MKINHFLPIFEVFKDVFADFSVICAFFSIQIDTVNTEILKMAISGIKNHLISAK
jgi:hypothetical protein